MKYKLINERDKNNQTLLLQVLENRGIENPEHYLHLNDSDIINPAIITNIKAGAIMLMKHIKNNDNILVIVDSDTDGYTSAAFMINYLNQLFPFYTEQKVKYVQHEDKGHGIIIDKVTDDIKLVICPDAGSGQYDLHKQLKDRGIDTLVIDHHNAEKYSEDACVINNQLDTNYTTKSLSGVGIVYKFCSYIDSLLNKTYANNLLDLVAVGVVADIMDLRDYETKYLVDKGCQNVINPFILGMTKKNSYQLKNHLNAKGIGWYISPSINAVTRVGTNEEKRLLFNSFLDNKAYKEISSTKRGEKGNYETILEQSIRTCNNVRNRQNKVRDSLTEKINKLVEEKNLTKNKIILIQNEDVENEDKELTGLIANKIMSEYQHPVLFLNKNFDDETGELIWSGSGRNNPMFGLESLQQLVKESGCCTLAEGHDNAFGCIIPDSSINNFIVYSNARLADIDFTPIYRVDMIYQSNRVDLNDILSIADNDDLWGQGIEEPIVAIENVKITKDMLNLFNEKTLKINLPENFSLVKFNSNKEEYESLLSEDGYISIDVVGRCARNTGWDNSPELLIEDFNIKKKQEYYF